MVLLAYDEIAGNGCISGSWGDSKNAYWSLQTFQNGKIGRKEVRIEVLRWRCRILTNNLYDSQWY